MVAKAVLDPPPVTELRDLVEVVAIIERIQVASASTADVYIDLGIVRLRHVDSGDVIGSVLITEDGENYSFVAGEVIL